MIINNNSSSSGGIGFLGLLCVVFIVLRLLGVITWSWLWVLAPIWIPIVIVVGVIVAAAVYTGAFKRKK